MGMTAVPEKLAGIRAEAIKLRCAGSERAAETMTRRWYENKKYQSALSHLPDVLVIKTPKVGNIAPIDMSVKATLKGPIAIEATDASLTWLTQAVAWQVKSNKVRCKYSRNKDAKDDSDASDSGADDHQSDESGDHKDGDGHIEAAQSALQPHPQSPDNDASEPVEKRPKLEPATTQASLKSFFKPK